ncbi:MAG: hypothetical protein J7M18_00600 [Candidatus Eremiobacteraeota bacterium]|nr:hypothetical protein [Candidatus Eremiobacteraeota bacterium]
MDQFKRWKWLMILLSILWFGSFSLAYGAYPPAKKTVYGWEMPDGEQFIFLGQIDARAKMVGTDRDGFLNKITNLDMELRMRENLDPADFDSNFEKFKTFLKDSTRTWMINEKNEVFSRLQKIYFAAKETVPGFIPNKVYFIKTSGDEEIKDMYVRGECIIIPQNILDEMTGKEGGKGYQYIGRRGGTKISRQDYLTHRLACMLFHVLRARNNALETKLYSLIGFYPVASVEAEGKFKEKIITDPTCWNTDYIAAVVDDMGKRTFIAPVCYSIASTYNRAYGKNLCDYRRMALVEVTRGDRFGSYREKYSKSGEPLITMPSVYPDFYENVKDNSNNLNHPATIIADNAALAVMLKEWEKKYRGFGINLNHNLLSEIRKILITGN